MSKDHPARMKVEAVTEEVVEIATEEVAEIATVEDAINSLLQNPQNPLDTNQADFFIRYCNFFLVLSYNPTTTLCIKLYIEGNETTQNLKASHQQRDGFIGQVFARNRKSGFDYSGRRS